MSVTPNRRLLSIQERSTTSLKYTSFIGDDTILYFENRNTKMSSFFSKLDLKYSVLNPQSVKLAHISQNTKV